MVHKSKIDWWMGILLVIFPVLSLSTTVYFAINGSMEDAIWMLISFLTFALIYIALVFPLEYRIEEDILVIRYGFVKSKIEYDKIKSVKATRSLLSAPALSLDRLAIDCGDAFPVLVSPKSKIDFLKDLSTKTPHLNISGETLE